MRIEHEHALTADESYKRISNLLSGLQSQYADKITNPTTSWNSDHTRMDFSMEIMGFRTSGQICLTDHMATLDGKIPLMARPFSGKIENMIKSKLDELLS